MVGAEANLVVWLLAGISFFWLLHVSHDSYARPHRIRQMQCLLQFGTQLHQHRQHCLSHRYFLFCHARCQVGCRQCLWLRCPASKVFWYRKRFDVLRLNEDVMIRSLAAASFVNTKKLCMIVVGDLVVSLLASLPLDYAIKEGCCNLFHLDARVYALPCCQGVV